MDLREEKEEDVILMETVKLLNVSVGASKRASQLIAKFFMKVRRYVTINSDSYIATCITT